jgi:hypothetical protein
MILACGRYPDEPAETRRARRKKEKGEPAMNENEIGRIIVHKKLGFLLNFGAAVMKEGITRTVNGLEEDR